jgi:hypothetical protein
MSAKARRRKEKGEKIVATEKTSIADQAAADWRMTHPALKNSAPQRLCENPLSTAFSMSSLFSSRLRAHPLMNEAKTADGA